MCGCSEDFVTLTLSLLVPVHVNMRFEDFIHGAAEVLNNTEVQYRNTCNRYRFETLSYFKPKRDEKRLDTNKGPLRLTSYPFSWYGMLHSVRNDLGTF